MRVGELESILLYVSDLDTSAELGADDLREKPKMAIPLLLDEGLKWADR